MKFTALVMFISTILFTLSVNAKDLDEIKAKQFYEYLDAYGRKHSENLELLTKYSKIGRTEAEDYLYFWTVCNTVTNLERAEKLILDNPEYAQYLNGDVLPSIQDNLDFHKYAASILNGTDAECRS